MVVVELIDQKGEKFPTYTHEGKTYFAAKKGKKYAIKLTNFNSTRVEVCISVDGQDVLSGEPSNYINQTGYILYPYQTMEIKGYRQNMDEVAAFEFVDKGDSRADLMNQGENVGVIGVAVFREKCTIPKPPIGSPLKFWDTLIGPKKTTPPYWYKSIPNTSLIGDGTVYPSDITFCSSTPQELGTAYGNSIDSKVVSTHFTRENATAPDEITVVYYDSKESLIEKGIIKPSNQEPKEPNPFPGLPKVQRGFAGPPPPKRKT